MVVVVAVFVVVVVVIVVVCKVPVHSVCFNSGVVAISFPCFMEAKHHK